MVSELPAGRNVGTVHWSTAEGLEVVLTSIRESPPGTWRAAAFRPATRLIETPPPRRAPSAAHGLYLHTVASCARHRAVYRPGVVRRPAVCGVLCGTYNP